MFHYEDFTLDLEQEDRVETALISLRYTGTKSSVAPGQLRQQGGWPGTQPFQGGEVLERDQDGTVVKRAPGPIQIGLNPDWIGDGVEGGTLTGLESNPDFDVIYDSGEIARAMLEANYLPTDVFGSPPDQDPERRATPEYEVREAVFEAIGLEDVGSGPGSHGEYREQLAEIAGIDLHAEDDSPVDASRAQQYIDDYTRSELVNAVDVLHSDAESDITGKLEAAEWLATQSSADVRGALRGESPSDEQGGADPPFNPADATVADLDDRVDDVSTVAELEALLEAEANGKDRKTAKEAIDDRLSDVRDTASE